MSTEATGVRGGTPTVAVLATLDTKGDEAAFLRERIEAQGCRALIVDLGVIGEPAFPGDITRRQVCEAGGSSLATLLQNPTRQAANPVIVGGASKLLLELVSRGEVASVLGLGGTQGTSTCSEIMRALPYGVGKLMVSTVASGDTSAFVGIKDVTMSFAVADILGLNPFTRRILANAAGAACGMAQVDIPARPAQSDKPVIGMSNLGVLTDGAMHALQLFEARGYEVIVFHAIGAGGRAMEQMMREGLIGAVFDYAMGEIADDVFSALRAGGPDRLSVAGALGLPQVLCPGGAEHVGLLVEPNTVPERWQGRPHVFHSPVVLAPRLNAEELERVAASVGQRLQSTRGDAVLMLPLRGSSRYSVDGGPLRDPDGDRAFYAALRQAVPASVRVVECDAGAEDESFVEQAVDTLLSMLEPR